MSEEIKKIWDEQPPHLDEKKLMDYLNHQLNKEQIFEVENTLTNDAFTSDAIEGLQQMNHPEKLQASLAEIKSGLARQIEKNKSRRNKKWKDSFQIYLLIFSILLLLFLGYLIVSKSLSVKQKSAESFWKNNTSNIRKTPIRICTEINTDAFQTT